MNHKKSTLTKSNEKHVEGLTKAVAELYKNASNTWVSVQEKSIVDYLKAENLGYTYSTLLVDELKSRGLIFVEGESRAMRYRISNDKIPDFEAIARIVVTKFKDKISQYNKNKRLDERPNPDLLPKYTPLQKETIHNGTLQIMPHKQVGLGDLRYVLFMGRIFEVRVNGLQEDEEGKVLLSVTHHNPSDLTADWSQNFMLKDTYDTSERLTDVLLKKVSRHIKKPMTSSEITDHNFKKSNKTNALRPLAN